MTKATQKPGQPLSDVKSGQVVKVHQKIKELNTKGEEKERIQIFEGTIIAVHGGHGQSATFTVRKISDNIGVEKIFPLHSPSIVKIEIIKELRTRRAKLYYLKSYGKKPKEKSASGRTAK
ncbi:MAG: 50S ribosomal protein L19 [bacterium]